MHTIFVTVGSTYFDPLIHSVLDAAFISTCRHNDIHRLIVQYGRGTLPDGFPAEGMVNIDGVGVELHQFISAFEETVRSADVVVSHGGSGSIVSALRAHKKLIVVPNTSLMDNHQAELGEALSRDGFLMVATAENLSDTFPAILEQRFKPFPEYDPSKFSRIMDETMGYSASA